MIALLLLLIFIVYRIYKSKRPLTKFGHFYDKSFYLEEKKEYEKALDLRKQALELDTLTNLERAELNLANARMYLRLEQYINCTLCKGHFKKRSCHLEKVISVLNRSHLL